ncbi:hypothetical protein F5Y02DRAFT_230677 [Annulohypoxylon stygium]|nr:hypothetical protein F5Y02DRAFT_230677 [Annulohypoxylon stygium]
MIDDFDGLHVEIQTIAKDQPRRLGRAAHRSKKWVKEQRPALTNLDTLLGWVKPARSDSRWTNKMEHESQQELRHEPYLKFLRKPKLPKSNERFIPMWKKICRIRNIFPIQIIHRDQHLEYGASDPVKLSDGTEVPTPFWMAGFCEKITRLALGGPWGGDMDLLMMFIRYAAACRLNDRRPVRLVVGIKSDSSFLNTLHDNLFKNRDASLSIPRIHQELRRQFRQEELPLPWTSTMLRSIEILAYKRETPSLRGGEGSYKVTSEDLHTVERAVSNCKDAGRPLFPPVRDAARIVSHARGFDQPKSYMDVVALIKACYKNDKRIHGCSDYID